MKKLIEFIKNIFKSKNIKETIKKETIKIEETIIEEKTTIENKDLENAKHNSFQKIKIGDIIIAKRYNSKEEKMKILNDHRRGPFIVLAKNDEGLICAYGTGVYNKTFYEISKDKFTLTKDTYFNFNDLRIITPFHFTKYATTLSEKELKNIYEYCKKHNNNSYKFDKNNIKFEYPKEEGDIILYNSKRYLILEINEKIKLLELSNNKIDINELDKLDYSKIIEIDPNKNISYITKLDNNLYMHVLFNLKNHFEYLKEKNTLQRGSIMQINNNHYLVNHIEDNKIYAYFILKQSSNGYYQINLNREYYYINYMLTTIDNKEDFKVIDLVSEEIMQEIRKKKKEVSLKTKNDEFAVGTIVKDKNYKAKTFIISGKDINNKLRAIDIDELKKANIITVRINSKEAVIIEDFDLNDITYIKENPDFKLREINKKINSIIERQKEYMSENSINIKKFSFGDIVMEENGFIEYIVLNTKEENVSCISSNSIKEDFPNVKIFNVNDVRKVGQLTMNELKQIKSKFSLTIKSAKKKV